MQIPSGSSHTNFWLFYTLHFTLAILFNLSLLSVVFPFVWKESYVFLLFKSGDKRSISNYRGISFLSVTPKLFEKLDCDVITTIIRPLISDGQHGFDGGRFLVTSRVEFSNFGLYRLFEGFRYRESWVVIGHVDYTDLI
jgi:hypothetical protein